jgi:hypothetical protein
MMKLKMLFSLVLLAGLCMVQSIQAQTYNNFPLFDDSETYAIWYADRAGYDNRPFTAYWDGGALGTDVTGPYLPHDIVGSVTIDGLTWDIKPETDKFNNGGAWDGTAATNFWRSAPYDSTADGGKYLESLTFYGRNMVGTESNVVLIYTINSNTLDTNRYEVDGFIKVVDVSDGTAHIETNLSLTAFSSGTYTQILDIGFAPTWAPAPLQAGFRILGTNANPAFAAAYGSFNVTIDDLILIAPDPLPPTPDPMTFAVAPYTVSDNKVGMVATEATDISGVEYQFQRITGGIQVYTSSVPEIVIDGLSPNTAYSFRVRAVDKSSSANATAYSAIFPVSTLPTDNDTPTPNPAEIGATDASSQSVKLTANPASDASGSAVEYYFTAVSGDNALDSGWIGTNVYVNTALAASTDYTYTVQVRDLSAATNTTLVSDPVLVTTDPFPIAGPLTNDLKGYTGTNNDGETAHEVLADDLEFADYLPNDRRIAFDATGATFGTYTDGNFGRNIIRTLGNTYADQDFEAYVTVSGWTAFVEGGAENNNGDIFIGFGPGDIGAFGIPDWNYENGNTNASFICEITGIAAGIWSQTNNSVSNIVQDATAALAFIEGDDQRIKLVFDFAAQEGTLIIDQSYDGVTFNAEVTVGPVTVPVFNQQSKIFLGADDGVTLSDFEIIGGGAPVVPVSDLSIVSSDGSTAVLQWTSVSGQTYDIVYKTDLTAGAWTLDAANENIPGTGGVLSPSSTVAGDDVFYAVETE